MTTAAPATDDATGPFARARVQPTAAARALLRRQEHSGSRRVAGVLAVVLLVSAGRWGAYIGLGSEGIFLTDVLLVAAGVRVIGEAILMGSARPSIANSRSPRGMPGVAAATLFVYVVVRAALGLDWSAVAIRDAAPYLYAVVAFISAAGIAAASEIGRRTTARLLVVGLRVHVLWVGLALLTPGLVGELPALSPTGDVHVLSVRADFDGAMLSVVVGLALVAALRGRLRWYDALLGAGAIIEIASLGSRAGLLALAAASLCAIVVVTAAKSNGRPGNKALVVVAATLLVCIGSIGLSLSPTGSKLLASLSLHEATTTLDVSGLATQRVRSEAWSQVVGYLDGDGAALFGVGFGPNFMLESGAIALLVGEDRTDVRSPHNYLIGTFARLGLVGLTLFLVLLTAIVRASARVASHIADDPLSLLAALICLTILVVSVVGVVMESPFGAVPFFWCAGVLLGQLPRRSIANASTPPSTSK